MNLIVLLSPTSELFYFLFFFLSKLQQHAGVTFRGLPAVVPSCSGSLRPCLCSPSGLSDRDPRCDELMRNTLTAAGATAETHFPGPWSRKNHIY